MLHEFLQKYKNEILELSSEKTKELAGIHGDSEQLKKGLPLFYEQLIIVLEKRLNQEPREEMLLAASSHGKEFLKLGYTLSHVVHSYGSMCQAITEIATRKNASITPDEFNIFNGCLDIAIAAAVSEFQFRNNENNEKRELKHLGFLAHELRNALSSATIAHDMIKSGFVGVGGSTANVLSMNLVRMRNLIDRSLSEVRMRADSDLFISKFRLSELFDQILIAANIDAKKRNQIITIEVDWKIEIEGDRQYLLSAISNLVQNAIKYSKSGGKVWLRGNLKGDRILVEIQDECGGIDVEKISSFFEPFVKENADRSGLGLGLSITQRAVHLSQGTIEVANAPGKGCTFIIDLPLKVVPIPSHKTAVPGKDSVQPNFSKK
jgi:signal transduction histidine kinase